MTAVKMPVVRTPSEDIFACATMGLLCHLEGLLTELFVKVRYAIQFSRCVRSTYNCARIFLRHFRDRIRVPKNENWVPRIRENYVSVIECKTYLVILN